MSDFLSFRKMITPVVIQILFWLGVLICVAAGLLLFAGSDSLPSSGFVSPRLAGLLLIVVGPILVRIYCELLIVLFRIHESLRAIEHNTMR